MEDKDYVLGKAYLSVHLRTYRQGVQTGTLNITYPNGNLYQVLSLEPEVAIDIARLASPKQEAATSLPQSDPEYLSYVLNELHKAQAEMSWQFLPPYAARENAMRAVIDRLVEVIDAMAKGR